MSFRVIKGTFHVVGYSPDGDSIRFKADNPDNWKLLMGRSAKLNTKQHAQLRIEAIDTLETHYKGEHQPAKFADSATGALLALLGIKNVVWNPGRSKIVSADDGVYGYVVSRTTEEYGRPVSFLFSSAAQFDDGQELFLNPAIVRKSINFKMLSKGMAYPTFYDGMFYDLRELFAKAASKERGAKTGIWSQDRTNTYTSIASMEDVTERNVLLPKLFRRIVAHIKKHGAFDPTEFVADLAAKPEKVLILSILHFTHFDNVISVSKDGKIKLAYKPEDLVFLS
jgi:endonuclease YncB( thermonuclease family)